MNGVPALRSVLSIKRRLLSYLVSLLPCQASQSHYVLYYLKVTISTYTEIAEGTPISSPLIPALPSSTGNSETQEAICKSSKVQAVLKGIKQSPKKLNSVAALVRGMRVEDALLQLQVTVKRAAKTVYQVIHLNRANATHNHGLDLDRLLRANADLLEMKYRFCCIIEFRKIK